MVSFWSPKSATLFLDDFKIDGALGLDDDWLNATVFSLRQFPNVIRSIRG
jgi:hypothetical protein